jgi:hypothetical protein
MGAAAAIELPDSRPFAEAAEQLRAHGLAVIPLGGDDGKKPMIRWQNMKSPPTRLGKLVEKHGGANIGVLTGICKPHAYTVVDCDSIDLGDEAIRRFGDTPLKVATARGIHLWFKNAREGCRQRVDGMALDVRGIGGMVVVPPSVHRKSGIPYRFLEGDWRRLPYLPAIKPGALPALGAEAVVTEGGGDRRNRLFRDLMELAPTVESREALGELGEMLNKALPPPLSSAKVRHAVRNVWEIHANGQNYLALGSALVIPRPHMRAILQHEHNSDALLLYHVLRDAHWNRSTFVVVPEAMERANTIPGWSDRRYRIARDALIELGILEVIEPPRPKRAGLYALSLPLFQLRKTP